MFGFAVTPSFVFDLETRMQIRGENEYVRFEQNSWWREVAGTRGSTGRKDRLIWLLNTAKIEYVGRRGAEVTFEELLSKTYEVENRPATGGHQVAKSELEDLDGGGINSAISWAGQMGAYGSYWPQKQLATSIKANPTGYDSVAFFAATHPTNPFDTSVPFFCNDFTGAPAAAVAATSGLQPGACPIDVTNAATLDVAFNNLNKAISHVATFVMPNGEDPRFLRVVGIMFPPALKMRVKQLLEADFIAQAAASGGGSADVRPVVKGWGITTQICADELSAAAGGSDTTYYLLVEAPGTDEQLRAWTYIEREAFGIVYNDGITDAQLTRANELQWIIRGRNVIAPGHPFLMMRVRAT